MSVQIDIFRLSFLFIFIYWMYNSGQVSIQTGGPFMYQTHLQGWMQKNSSFDLRVVFIVIACTIYQKNSQNIVQSFCYRKFVYIHYQHHHYFYCILNAHWFYNIFNLYFTAPISHPAFASSSYLRSLYCTFQYHGHVTIQPKYGLYTNYLYIYIYLHITWHFWK